MYAADMATGAAAAIAGLPARSYATVPVARVPEGKGALRLSGRCPGCEAALMLGEISPVVGWHRQRGRCAACGQSFGRCYVAAELITAGAFAAFGLRFGPSLLLAPLCYLSVIGVVVSLIDMEHPPVAACPHPPVVPRGGQTAFARRCVHHALLAGSLVGMTVLWLFYALADPQLRVRGITRLRVTDASVIPVIPNAPLDATVLAIAEKAASLITGWD